MRFAKWVFFSAGIYGLIVLLPLYFLESWIGRSAPPPITHPEYYYGFVGVALAWQVLFLLVSRDPRRYRAVMLPSVLEKAVFGIAAIVLYMQQRIPASTIVLSGIDLIWGLLFIVAYVKTAAEISMESGHS